MSKNPFGDIAKKKKAESFIDDAKVDGLKDDALDPKERRGSSFKDPKTKAMIKLSGKVVQVPMNAYEVKLLTQMADEAGLPLATFLRVTALQTAKVKNQQ
ncbi:hypothetical protein ERW49_18845 [Aliivibrio finisterrensis]|uniref:Uncharacterized protein n=1 Tax=Aliivibrio finisterrensis TaxID=511998 RepID=A0A4Q5K5Y4_9GAMM|nr:hypothetical protein [Aliivibrio finisterrensis]RYU41127.1 hypothetical protein ERW49_18845 [Aliivibrio finisterrensis]